MSVALAEYAIPFRRQLTVPILFHGRAVEEQRIEVLIGNDVVAELKAIKAIEDVHHAIMRSYLRATDFNRGLLFNFAATSLQVKRIGADFHARR